MAMVMLTCPTTGKPVPAGVETDELSFDALADSVRGKDRGKVLCPHCGKSHTWSTGGAYLAADSPAQQPLVEEGRLGE